MYLFLFFEGKLEEMINIKELELELSNKEHWEKGFARLCLKRELPVEELTEIWEIKECKEKREDIVQEVLKGEVLWSVPRKVKVGKTDTTKKRIVYMYTTKERYIQGILYRAISRCQQSEISDLCFSYKEGVCTGDAVQKMKQEEVNYKWGVKLDISAYFNSVPLEVLKDALEESFGLDTGIRKTLDGIYLCNEVEDKGKRIVEYKSLIPGCPMGSYFANFCLKEIDRKIGEQRGVVYLRYSDDIIIFGETEERVREVLAELKLLLSEKGLTLNPSKYTFYNPSGGVVDYLGLELSEKGVDISEHSKKKMKRKIQRWVRKGRYAIEIDKEDKLKVLKDILRRWNYVVYISYIEDARRFGWGYYAFRYIENRKSLHEIDKYMLDRLRYLLTGKNNKANGRISREFFEEYGFLPLEEMWELFMEDFDYYCERVSLIRDKEV